MLHKLVTGPLKLVKTVGEKVQEEVDREMYDLPTIQKKLVQLQMSYELGEIPQEDYEQQEEELLARYEIAKRQELEQWEELVKQRKE
ncbi:gas vesicle protein GvpG [Virgibacillus oceani]